MRINKVAIKFLALAAALILFALPLSNLVIKSADPFKPSKVEIDSTSIAGYYNQNFNWNDCYGGFLCATYKVPIDYRNLDLGEFDIAVMKHEAPNAIGNLVVNPGGPGGSGIDYVYSYASAFTDTIQDSFNIVGFDPRGVGRSSPIECLSGAETDQAYSAGAYPENDSEIAQMREESKAFAESCSEENKYLEFYSTANAARDMDILRALLADAKLNFLGKSYGTYLGTLYAKFFPDKVGKFVLDGAVDPTISSLEQTLQQAVGFDSAFLAFANNCIKDANCVLTGDVITQIQLKLAELHKEPMAVGNRKLTESLAMYGIAMGLYDQEFGWPSLRGALKDLFAGEGKPLLDLADAYTGRDSNGNYQNNEAEALTVISCADFPPSEIKVDELIAAAPLFGKYVAYADINCDYLPKSNYELISESINLNSQVLIIGTTNDPATPYRWAIKLAEVLSNSKLISVSGDGHTGYNRGIDCVDQLVEKYLISGAIPAQNLACSA